MKTMIIDKLRAGGMSHRDAETALDSVMTAIVDTAKEHDGGARVPGFGTFKTKVRVGRQIRVPSTGEVKHTVDKTVLGFKPAKGLIL